LQYSVLLDQSPDDVKVYGDVLHALSVASNRRILNVALAEPSGRHEEIRQRRPSRQETAHQHTSLSI
jgi:hypothetical protein